MIRRRFLTLRVPLAVWSILAILAKPTAADITVQHNVAFNAKKRNPYTGGPAFEESATYSLIDESLRADIPPIDADPLGVALEAFLGVELPSVVKLQVGGTLAGHAKLEFGYYVTSGRLDINYPASANLNIQTNGSSLFANQPYTIDSQFLPGVSPRVVTSQFLTTQGGAGYLSAPLVSFNNYEMPSFATTSPWAQAWLDASADVRAGMFAKVTALAGLQEWRKEFRVGGKVGGRLVEIDPTGLCVFEEPCVGVSLDQPIGPFPVAGGAAQLEIRVPKLDVQSGPQTGPVITARATKPVATLTGNLEKLIPFVGNVLHNSIGPFEYDLLQLQGGPEIGLYQKMSFTPDPKVVLDFSEPVLVQGAPCGDAICVGPGILHQTTKAKAPLGQSVNWRPMFSNSSAVTIVPTYLLDNQFRNETGIDLDFIIDVESLSLAAPFFPTPNHTIGPIINERIPIDIAEIELKPLTSEFQIPIGSVTGDPIVVPKSNVGIEFGLGDLQLITADRGASDPQNPGYTFFDLTFTRAVSGQPPRQYQKTISAQEFAVQPTGGGEEDVATVLEALSDVVLDDPGTGGTLFVGRMLCIERCNLSAALPATNPAYVDPNPAIGKLFVTSLPDDPNIDVNIATHPVLGAYNGGTPVNTIGETEYGTEIVDRANYPLTTVVARRGEPVPAGISEFNSLTIARMLPDGDVMLRSTLTAFAPESATVGVFAGDDAAKSPVVRGGDSVPGGGRLDLGGFNWSVYDATTNDAGQVAIVSQVIADDSTAVVGTSLFRGGPGGLVTIARVGDSLPAGGGTVFQIFAPMLNATGQVAFGCDILSAGGNRYYGLFVGDGTTLRTVVRDGDAVPGTTAQFESYGYFSLNDQGHVAFDAYTTENYQGLFLHDGQSIRMIARDGDAVPQGGNFVSFNDHKQNDAGQVTFAAGLRDSPGANLTFGLFRGDGTSLVQIAREGELAPDGDGALSWNGLFNFEFNDAGMVLFNGLVDSAVEYRALLLGDGVDLTQIARTGSPAPGGGIFAGFGGRKLNNRGHVAFTAELSGIIGGDDADAAYLFDGRNLVELARFGQPFAGSTIVVANVGAINDEMQVAYDVRLADGRRMIARFEPTLYWRHPGNGDWDAPDNWSLFIQPFDPYDVVLELAAAATISGSFADRIVKSIRLGGPTSAPANLRLQTGATLTAINGTVIRENGILGGDGTIGGNLFNFAGRVSPGVELGELHVAGDYAQGSLGTLLIQLGGRLPGLSYDQLMVAGEATLTGTIDVSLLGFAPAVGDSFTVLTYGQVAGAFESISMPVLPDGRGWLLSYGANGATFTVTPEELPGDADLDGDVDQVDVARLAANFGRTYAGIGYTTDLDHDGATTLLDIALLQSHLGHRLAPSPSATTVPEPSTMALLVVGLVSGWCRCRRRNCR